jgi:hypothetical protein
MTSPFKQLKQKKNVEATEFDEWEGQFSCSTYQCNGYAKIAKYSAKDKLLVWKCQDGHTSRLENVDE